MTKKEKTRLHIIRKSAPVLNRKGIAGTTIEDIMNATGLKKGGIYGHFKGKDEIVAAAYDYMARRMVDKLSEVIAPEESAEGKIKAIINFYKSFIYSEEIQGGCPIMNFGVEVDDTNPMLTHKVSLVINQMLTDLIRVVKYGIKRGEFRPDVNATEFADMFFSVIEGAILLSKVRKTNSAMVASAKMLEAEIARMKV